MEKGGILVIGCRSGYKNITGKCVMNKLPGQLASLTGTDIPEYSFISPDAGKVTVEWDGSAFTEKAAKIFLEKLGVAETYQDVVEAPPGCEIAVRRKGVRKGGTSRIWYFGCKS